MKPGVSSAGPTYRHVTPRTLRVAWFNAARVWAKSMIIVLLLFLWAIALAYAACSISADVIALTAS
jgi:hypothetical protein